MVHSQTYSKSVKISKYQLYLPLTHKRGRRYFYLEFSSYKYYNPEA